MWSFGNASGRMGAHLILTLIFLFSSWATGAGATWTTLSNQAPQSVDSMLLLTDGSVLAHQAGCGRLWFRLTPDAKGNYVNGTWSVRAPMSLGRLYFASHILPSGKLWVLG